MDTSSFDGELNVKIKNFISEISIWFKQMFHLKNCWILLPGLIALLSVYAVHHLNIYLWLITRNFNEGIAPLLVSLIFVILLIKSFISRNPLMIYLSVLALVFLVRELHATDITIFHDIYRPETKKLAYLLLVGMGLWAFAWHEKLFACLNRSMMQKVSLLGVLWTYLFSQLIARRVFRGVFPNEALLHISMEETVETAAHLFLLIFVLFCLFFIPNKRKVE
jgi:hypothetical protein